MREKRLCSAFTLIELLVVIAVIAVLLAITLPALKEARNSARSTACLSNERSIAAALVSYADDFKRIIPRECGSSDLSVPAVPLNSAPALRSDERVTISWAFNLRPYLDPLAHARDKLGGKNNDCFETASYYHDPARVRDRHTLHYAANGFRFSAPGVSAGTKPPSPLDLVRSPSETFYLTCFSEDSDELRARAWYSADSSTLQISQFYDLWAPSHLAGVADMETPTPGTAQRIAPRRHGGVCNVARFDGHASPVTGPTVKDLSRWDDGDYRPGPP
ncbi:MAG: type II secretion system protein [Phycisphaerales bacterium]|nr:type II secretion system protein [Planctomycetota bacterium]